MPNQSLCMSCRYGSSCADYIADQDTFVVRCDKYQKLITNSDKIRSMTDEDLSTFLGSGCLPISTMEHCKSGDKYCCRDCWLSWLKSPAEEVKDHA